MLLRAASRSPVILSVLIVLGAGLAYGENAVVELAGFSFQPSSVTIDLGESVTWVNIDGEVHSTTNGTGFDDPDYGLIRSFWFFNGPDETFTYTFDSPGDFPYFCIPHFFLGMTGTVTVRMPSSVEQTPWGTIKGLYR